MARVKKPPTPGRKPKPPPEPKPRAYVPVSLSIVDDITVQDSRLTNSCFECKRQKIFCSKHLPKCERCQAKKLDCSYAGSKKIRVNEDKLRYLKAKLERYEEIFRSLPPDIVSSLPDGLSPLAPLALSKDDDNDGDDDDDDSDSEHLEQAEETLPGHFKQMSLYLKASRGSADNFFQIASRMSGLRGDSGESGQEGEGDVDGDGVGDDAGAEQPLVFYDPGMLPRKPASGRAMVELPPVDVARHYFFSQQMYIGTIFAFSDPDTFEKQLDYAYDNSPPDPASAQACLTYAKILMILALGRLYSVNRGGAAAKSGHGSSTASAQDNDHPPGFVYFSHALTLLPDVHEPGSILGVETLAYVGYFLQNMNRRDAAFLYIGLALRMAISLGLHQELPSTSSVSEADREHRRRVWWSIYSLDRILSLKSGNPVSILDEDIAVRMPARLPGEAVDSPVVVLGCYTELSRILGEITALIYRRTAASKHTGLSLVQTVHAILQSLIQWEEALPRSLRLDPDRGKLSRESISMYLHYYQCINMTARPLLFHVVQKRIRAIRRRPAAKEADWQTGLSAKTVAVIRACMSAARNTVQFMSKAADHNMVATYGYMDGEHAFSAAIVLALVHTAFPTDATTVDAMGKALALLRRMGDLGNSYAASRYRQLARLQTILQPSEPAPVPVSGVQADQSRAQHQPQHQVYVPQEQPSGQPLDMGYAAAAQEHVNVLCPHHQYQFSLGLDPDLDLADIDSSGILFTSPPQAPGDISGLVGDQQHTEYNASGMLGGHTHAQCIQTPSGSVDLDETTLWTTAFTNPAANFDISQLMAGEMDMHDFFDAHM